MQRALEGAHGIAEIVQWKSIGLLAQPLAEGVVGHPIGINEIQNEDADKNADSI